MVWIQLIGRRHGHYNAKATAAAKLKRQMDPGTFRGMTLGVLVAARLSVLSARRQATQSSSSGSAIHSGAGTADSVLWNESMTNIQMRSRNNNIPGVTRTRIRPGGAFVAPAGVDLKASGGAARPLARDLPYSPKVAIVAANKANRGVAKECRTITGTHRCAEADLVVVQDLAILHNVDVLA